MEHEVGWKARTIALHGLIQRLDVHLVERGEVRVEQDAVPAHDDNGTIDPICYDALVRSMSLGHDGPRCNRGTSQGPPANSNQRGIWWQFLRTSEAQLIIILAGLW